MTTKIEKQRNIEAAIKNDDGLWDKKAPYHWVRSLKGKQLDYWPTTNHFRYLDKSYHDLNVYDFINSISDKNTMIDGAEFLKWLESKQKLEKLLMSKEPTTKPVRLGRCQALYEISEKIKQIMDKKNDR